MSPPHSERLHRQLGQQQHYNRSCQRQNVHGANFFFSERCSVHSSLAVATRQHRLLTRLCLCEEKINLVSTSFRKASSSASAAAAAAREGFSADHSALQKRRSDHSNQWVLVCEEGCGRTAGVLATGADGQQDGSTGTAWACALRLCAAAQNAKIGPFGLFFRFSLIRTLEHVYFRVACLNFTNLMYFCNKNEIRISL